MNLRIQRDAKTNEDQSPSGNKEDNNSDKDNGITYKGDLLMDASVSPQDIAYPTDLNLLNEARDITENVIDFLHFMGDICQELTVKKPARNT